MMNSPTPDLEFDGGKKTVGGCCQYPTLYSTSGFTGNKPILNFEPVDVISSQEVKSAELTKIKLGPKISSGDPLLRHPLLISAEGSSQIAASKTEYFDGVASAI